MTSSSITERTPRAINSYHGQCPNSLEDKRNLRELVEAYGYAVIFLPRYSPDLNDIEHDFAAIKKLRAYDTTGKTLDEIIKDYCVA